MARKAGRSDPAEAVVVGLEINSRREQIEVTTMLRGKGRHTHYPTLSQVPPALQADALLLIRTALANSGYESLAELDKALTSELVVPDHEEEG